MAQPQERFLHDFALVATWPFSFRRPPQEKSDEREGRRTMGVMLRTRSLVIAGTFSLAGAGSSLAGVVDSPLPVLQTGARTHHVFTVPGVIKNNNIETVFSCTSLEKSGTIVVAVEVFGALGGAPLNDASTPTGDGAETLQVGETATITTGATVAFHEDEIIDSLGPASVRNGSARIVSTSKRIACSAFIADELNDPPGSMTSLTILYKQKQKGD